MRKLEISPNYMPTILGISYDQSASFYYRIIAPLRALYEVYGLRVSWAHIEEDKALGAAFYDMVILSRVSVMEADRVRATIQRFHEQGTRIVLDYDDNFLAIPDWNPAKLSTQAQDSIRDLLGLVDGVIVTNEALRKVYMPYAKRVAVLPNYIETHAWPDTRKPNPTIRIGLYGSASHIEDWKLIEKPMRRILVNYGDRVTFSVSAPIPQYLSDLPLEIQPWVSLDRYPMLLNQVDIGLCPLIDDAFNRCKSNIKALELGMAGAAIVASPTQYRELVAGRGTIARNEEEWYAGIEKYILSAEKRRLAGRLLKQTVTDRFSIQQKAPQIIRVYKDLYRDIMHAQGVTYATSMS